MGKPDFLTVKQVAERLGVSNASVYRLIEAGQLSAHRIGVGRGTLRVSEAALESYLRSVEVVVGGEDFRPSRGPLRHIDL
jgi:excisionase family DNA binding protein